jgi:hypothetical protein
MPENLFFFLLFFWKKKETVGPPGSLASARDLAGHKISTTVQVNYNSLEQ